jgi:hypothetical protein
MTVIVKVEEGVITKTPPIVRWARGKPIETLCQWMLKQPGFHAEITTEGEEHDSHV